jgi:hypothetical protein
MLFDRLFLVLTDQVSVVAFIQSPVLVDGDIFLTELHENQIGRSNAATKHGCVDFIKLHARLREHLTSDTSLENSIVGKGSIRPTNETVIAIPSRLAMSHKAKCVGRLCIQGCKATGC